MLLLAVMAFLDAVPDTSGWIEFDRSSDGFIVSPSYYDPSRVERRGASVRIWVQRKRHYSGRNDSTVHFRYEIDCRQRLSRILVAVDFNEDLRPPSLYRRRFHGPLLPIEDDSIDGALAGRVCPAS